MAINPNQPPNLFAQALSLAKVTEALTLNYSNDAMLGLLTLLWGNPLRFSMVQRDATYPARIYVTYPGTSIACYEGVQSNNQAVRMGAGYVTPGIIAPPFQSGHSFIAQLTVNQLAVELANTLPRQEFLTLAGHSMGGCIAQCLGSGAEQAGTWGRVKSTSFGSPSWCYGRDLALLEVHTSPRWMLEGDVIPKIWPRISEGPICNVAAGAGYLLARRYQQSAQGIFLHDDGQVEYINRPPPAADIAEVDVATLIWDVSNQRFNPHNIASYIQWFTMNVNEPVPQSRTRGQVPEVIRDDVPPIDHLPARALPRIVKPALRDRHRLQYGPKLTVPKSVIFVAEKDGGSWGVKCQGVWLMWAMRRKRATHTAFLLNRLFKEMLRAGVVYPATYVKQWAIVMAQANAGEDGISPPMNFDALNVVLPARVLR